MDEFTPAEKAAATELVHAAEQQIAAAAPRPAVDVAAIVEACWHDHMPGSAVARSTEAWNVAGGFKEDLKRRLAAALAA